MKLNTKQMDRVINKFFKTVGANDLAARMGTDFCYYYYENVVDYSIIVSERMDRMFMDFAKSIGLKVECGVFILSLLHEVGHHMTIDEIDDDVYKYCEDVKANLTDSDEDVMTYFNLPDEKIATEWAIDYINNNFEIVKVFSSHFQKVLLNFIKKYDIELIEG